MDEFLRAKLGRLPFKGPVFPFEAVDFAMDELVDVYRERFVFPFAYCL